MYSGVSILYLDVLMCLEEKRFFKVFLMMRGMAIFFCFLPFSDLSRITLTTLVERNGEEIERLFHLYVNMSSAYNTLRQKSIYLCSKKKRKNGFVFLARKFKDWAKIWIFSRSV